MASRKSNAHKSAATRRKSQANEGEGNRTAARAYDAKQWKFAESGEVEEKAHEAKEAIEGSEAEDLRRAEDEGKSRSRGEDPLLGSIKREKP